MLANKSDLFDNEMVKEEDGRKFAEILKAKFLEISAKDDFWVSDFEGFLKEYLRINK